MTLLRLMCAVSVWRTLMTRVLPLAGCASWWAGLVCLLPGLIVDPYGDQHTGRPLGHCGLGRGRSPGLLVHIRCFIGAADRADQ